MLRHAELQANWQVQVDRIVFVSGEGWVTEPSNLIVEKFSEDETIILRNFIVTPWCQQEWQFFNCRVRQCSSRNEAPFLFSDSENSQNRLSLHYDAIWRPIDSSPWDVEPTKEV